MYFCRNGAQSGSGQLPFNIHVVSYHHVRGGLTTARQISIFKGVMGIFMNGAKLENYQEELKENF